MVYLKSYSFIIKKNLFRIFKWNENEYDGWNNTRTLIFMNINPFITVYA